MCTPTSLVRRSGSHPGTFPLVARRKLSPHSIGPFLIVRVITPSAVTCLPVVLSRSCLPDLSVQFLYPPHSVLPPPPLLSRVHEIYSPALTCTCSSTTNCPTWIDQSAQLRTFACPWRLYPYCSVCFWFDVADVMFGVKFGVIQLLKKDCWASYLALSEPLTGDGCRADTGSNQGNFQAFLDTLYSFYSQLSKKCEGPH